MGFFVLRFLTVVLFFKNSRVYFFRPRAVAWCTKTFYIFLIFRGQDTRKLLHYFYICKKQTNKHPSYNQLKVFLLHPSVPSDLLYNIVIQLVIYSPSNHTWKSRSWCVCGAKSLEPHLTLEPQQQYAQKTGIHHPQKKVNFKPWCPSAELTDHGGKVGVSK